jgi:hypothetical protein
MVYNALFRATPGSAGCIDTWEPMGSDSDQEHVLLYPWVVSSTHYYILYMDLKNNLGPK